MSHDLPPIQYRKWKQEQAEMLSQKDAEEQASLEELKVQARNELAEWYARHEEQLNQTKTLNRSVSPATAAAAVL